MRVYRCCCRKFCDGSLEFNLHIQNCSEAWEFLRTLNALKKEGGESLFEAPEKYT